MLAGLAVVASPSHTFAADCQMAVSTQEALAFSRPAAGSVIKEFGDQYDEMSKSKKFHGGVDLDGPEGEQVYAARSGKVIEAGRQIGKIGATGRTPGSRLHFEVLRDGKPVNPLDFIQ